MNLSDKLKNSLLIANNKYISDDIYRNLLEKSFTQVILLESLGISDLYKSKEDVIKELHATFMHTIIEFGRNNFTKDNVKLYLLKSCNYTQNRADFFADLYEKNRLQLLIRLGNIGTHLPHVVDVNWSIDYVIKTNNLVQADGPIFRVELITECFDVQLNDKKRGCIKFSCDSQELQDFVYKLKDAVRHCQKIGSEH